VGMADKEIFMTTLFGGHDAARFLRTLRVATQTALAQDDLRRGRGLGRPAVAFQALAAKGAGPWLFPDAGVMSSDGLVLAHLARDAGGSWVLDLQAQGLAGMSAYALRAARVVLGSGVVADGEFDRDGRLRLTFAEAAIGAADASAFELQLLDDAP